MAHINSSQFIHLPPTAIIEFDPEDGCVRIRADEDSSADVLIFAPLREDGRFGRFLSDEERAEAARRMWLAAFEAPVAG